MVLATGLAEEVCEASAQDSTRHKAVQLVGHELGQRASAGLVGPLLLEGQQVSLDYLEKGSLLGLPARVHQAGR